jgi:hypothetical protein
MSVSSASGQVSALFDSASSQAESAVAGAKAFMNSLSATLSPPTLNVTWTPPTPPTFPAMPQVPVAPTIAFTEPQKPTDTALPAVAANIFTFVPVPNAPTIQLPQIPTLEFGSQPIVPEIGTVSIPDAPEIREVSIPSLLSLNPVPLVSVDLREDWLDRLEATPTLELLEPTSYYYARGPEYASSLLEQLKEKLRQRMNGGTGLDPAVEQAIWDRARDRETRIALASEQEAMRTSEALGFQLPAGVLAAQIREAQQTYLDKLSGLSRDIGIKQAELEQSNLKETIVAGMQLESQLMDYSYKLEMLAFETAKETANNAILVYNAGIERFKVLMEAYRSYAEVYKTLIEGQLAKVEVYKAQLGAEETKATINNALVQQYKAQVEASMASVELYKAQLSGAQALVEIEKTKIEAAGEQTRAYVARVNAETAKVEVVKAQAAIASIESDVYRSRVQGYSANIQAQAERARVEIARYSAMGDVKKAEWDAYRARVEAEKARVEALGVSASANTEAFKAGATAIQAQSEAVSAQWRAALAQYSAGQNIAFQAAKANADSLLTTRTAQLEASKVGAQIYAQVAASAYGMINASASMSSNASLGVNYSYTNDEGGVAVPPL